jgi:hypothetical protein
MKPQRLNTLPTQEAYSELQTAYDRFNADLFGGQLPPCLITLQRKAANVAGYFSHRRFGGKAGAVADEIAMNPMHFHGTPAAQMQALQTLVHEMTHLWQFHFGKPSRKTYHNGEWADKMEAVGLMPSSTGKEGGSRTGQKMADYPIAGGLFETAAKAFLAEGHALSWRDRLKDKTKEDEGKPVDGDGDGEDGEEGEGEEKKSGKRIKFTCIATLKNKPKQQHNIWGKDSTRALCLECNVPFERID